MSSRDSDGQSVSVKKRHEDDLFSASYDRCINLHDGDVRFVNHFYGVLKGRDPDIAEIFEAFPVHHQVHVLRTALYLLVDFCDNQTPSADFTKLVDSHTDNHLGLRPYMLEIWLECILETVAEYDPQFSEVTKAAWITKIKPGIDFLKSALEKA